MFDELGRVRGEQHRAWLTLDHTDQGGWGIGDRAALRATFRPIGPLRALWMTLTGWVWGMLGIAFLVGGTKLCWWAGQDIAHSTLLSLALVSAFWGYSVYWASRA